MISTSELAHDGYAKVSHIHLEDLQNWYSAFTLIASNFPAILPFLLSIAIGVYSWATIVIIAFLISVAYHTCQTTTFCPLYVGLPTWQKLDHTSAGALLAFTILLFIFYRPIVKIKDDRYQSNINKTKKSKSLKDIESSIVDYNQEQQQHQPIRQYHIYSSNDNNDLSPKVHHPYFKTDNHGLFIDDGNNIYDGGGMNNTFKKHTPSNKDSIVYFNDHSISSISSTGQIKKVTKDIDGRPLNKKIENKKRGFRFIDDEEEEGEYTNTEEEYDDDDEEIEDEEEEEEEVFLSKDEELREEHVPDSKLVFQNSLYHDEAYTENDRKKTCFECRGINTVMVYDWQSIFVTYVYLFVVFMTIEILPLTLQSFVIIIVFGVLVALLKIVIIEEGDPSYLNERYDATCLFIGFALVVISLAFYFIDGYMDYWIFHSLWHIFSFIGFAFIVIGVTRDLRPIEKTSKLIRSWIKQKPSSTYDKEKCCCGGGSNFCWNGIYLCSTLCRWSRFCFGCVWYGCYDRIFCCCCSSSRCFYRNNKNNKYYDKNRIPSEIMKGLYRGRG